MSKRKVVLFLLGITIISGVIFLRYCFTVDKCLDNGGRWNEKMSKCEYQ
jgi:hypothetical protein